MSNSNSFIKFTKKKFLTEDESANIFNFWFFFSAHSFFEFFEKLTKIVDARQNSADFYRRLFQFRTAKNRNILDCAKDNKDIRIHQFFENLHKRIKLGVNDRI